MLIAAPSLARAAPPQRLQWIAVAAHDLKRELQPLCDHRRQHGAEVIVIDLADVLSADQIRAAEAQPLRERLHNLCRKWNGPSCILLLGAATADGMTEPATNFLPPLRGTVGRMRGQPSDNGYGCPDGGLKPTVAVGRLPARTPAEARAMIRKIIAWETDRAPGLWKRQMTVLAGAPGFNAMVDGMVERASFSQFDQVSPAWTGRATYSNLNSPLNLPAMRIDDGALQQLAQGQAVIVYLGHSSAHTMWYAKVDPDENKWLAIFGRDTWAGLRLPQPSVFLTGGCNSCQLSGRDGEGYGLYAVRNPDGPAAVIGSHTACWSSMVMLLMQGVLPALPGITDTPRLGELWLRMKANVADGEINPVLYRALDAVDGDPKTPQATQRLEHLEMFMLLGDPAMRLPGFAHELDLKIAGEPTPGSRLRITTMIPPALRDAKGRITLERPLSSRAANLLRMPSQPDSPQRDRIMLENHRRSNEFILAESLATVTNNVCEAEIEIPRQCPWSSLIARLYLSNDSAEGMGVQRISIKPADATSPAASQSDSPR